MYSASHSPHIHSYSQCAKSRRRSVRPALVHTRLWYPVPVNAAKLLPVTRKPTSATYKGSLDSTVRHASDLYIGKNSTGILFFDLNSQGLKLQAQPHRGLETYHKIFSPLEVITRNHKARPCRTPTMIIPTVSIAIRIIQTIARSSIRPGR